MLSSVSLSSKNTEIRGVMETRFVTHQVRSTDKTTWRAGWKANLAQIKKTLSPIRETDEKRARGQ